MADTTVYNRFSRVAAKRGDAPFLYVLPETAEIYGIEPGNVSYREMLAGVDALATRLDLAGYGPGHRIGLLLENRPGFLELWLAMNKLGISVVPINPDLRIAELEYLEAHSEMCLAIALPDRIAELQQAAMNAGLNLPVISPNDELPLATHPAPLSGSLDSQSECALLYTSGTTGRPKGCILSNEYFLYSGDWYAETGGYMSLQQDHERMLTPLPVFHMNAMAVSVMAMMTTGGCLTMLDRLHAKTWWDSVRESKATIVHYLGVMPAILMSVPPTPTDRLDSVRFGFGAGIDKKLHAPFEERFGFPLLEAWACTETGSGGVISAHEEPRKVGTSCFGRPTEDVEIRIVDDADQDISDDTPGELLVRRAGKNPRFGFYSGYLKDEAATNEVWKGGWFRTGDVVSRDQDGDLHFVDRKKNVIRRAGENIAAVEVEMILNRHPDIRLSAAAAAPDDLRGDEVAAFLVLEQGDGSAEKAREIVAWALEQMAYYKVPGWVAFVTSLPLTATQKIQRGEMKALVSQTFESDDFHDTRFMKKRTA